jgi:diguanylate cyclase (GGDEF)-like protein
VKYKLKKRKLIGVIISEVEELYQHKLLKGIISECYSLDYDVAIFSTLIKDTGLPEYKIGEKNIFNLMNFDRFDGIIVAGTTLAIEHLPEQMERLLLHKCKCPVLYVDQESEHFPSIFTDDRKASEQITNHLIDYHGYKDIFCLAGNPEDISTISRLGGFKDSLIKHGIPIEESKISYEGDYCYTSGERLAYRFIRGELPKPEAVVCISDHMAIGLANELMQHGIRVPEDIAITGYDATDEAATSTMSITTLSPPVTQTGVDAVCELTRLITGSSPKPRNINHNNLEIGRSCGCNDIDYMKRSGILRLKEKSDAYKVLLDSYMTEALTSVTYFEDCITKFCHYLYLVKDYSDYYLCLCDNWDGSADNYSLEKEEDRKVGYSDKMSLALAVEKTQFVSSNSTFASKDMLPDLWKDREKPKAYYFTPIHFNDNCIGYSVLTYGDKVEAYDITYRNWSRNIMNALEFNRVHRKLYRSSFRDVLTGIYNRNGFNQNIPYTFNDAINQNKKLFVLMADLDNLKEINDKFGHREGDIVITVVANAFQSCCRNNDVCARIGGDEFLVVGVDEESYDLADSFITLMNQYVDIYNATSKKPYQIEISMGAVSDYLKDFKDIKEMVDRADKVMYVNKAKNKRLRK